MLTSIKSDLFLLRDQLRALLLVFAFMITMAYMQDSSAFVFFYASFMSVFTPFTLATLSEQSGWEAVLLSAPVSRSDMVRARYAVSLGFSCTLILIGFVMATLMQPAKENMYALLIYLAIVLLFISILLPLIYKFGTHKARFALMGMSMLPAAFMFLMGGPSSIQETINVPVIEQISTSIPFMLAINAVCLLILGLSCTLSCYIYRKKEF